RVIKIKKKSEYEKKYLESIFNESKYILNQKSLKNIVNYFQLSDIERKESNNKINPENICVKYDEMNFSEQFIVDQIYLIPEYHRTKINSYDALKLVIKGITLQQLLYDEVIKKGYDKVPIVIETAEKLKQQVYLKYKMSEILSTIQVNDSSLQNYYNNNLISFRSPNEISIQEIIVEDKSKADSIFNLLLAGEDFGNLAQRFSLRKISAQNDGVIDYTELSKFGNLKTEFWENEIGKLIEPIEVFGFYGIFKVLGKREGKPKSFEEVKNTVEKLYKNDFKKLLIKQYLEKIKKIVPISINFKDLSSLKTLENESK
ncbi:MAG: peptidylprolyl isomerase, partial [Ignavibacteria bacterium]|nr:peptidylprolyl isomerase [Ignavibacteria bacterium]